MLGERIRARRKFLQMSQQDLAGAVGADQGRISEYENNKSGATDEVLVALADALETTTDYLLGRTERPERIITSVEGLDPMELEALNVFRSASPEKRFGIIEIMKISAK